MGAMDELMREKGKIKGAESYLHPAQITAREIAAGAVGPTDIAANAVTAAKIAAAVAGDGVKGGAGTSLSLDLDASLSGAKGTGQQLGVATAGVVAAHIAANCKGNGVVAGAGAFVLAPDGVTTQLSGAQKLQLVDAGLTLPFLAAASRRHVLTIELPAFNPAGGTVRVGLLSCPVGRVYTILQAELSATVIPICAGGTCTVELVNSDQTAGAHDDILVAAWDAEGLVARDGTSLALIMAPAGINVMGDNDYLFLNMVSGAAVGTPWLGAVLTLEYEES